jgi:hypothetical protein
MSDQIHARSLAHNDDASLRSLPPTGSCHPSLAIASVISSPDTQRDLFWLTAGTGSIAEAARQSRQSGRASTAVRTPDLPAAASASAAARRGAARSGSSRQKSARCRSASRYHYPAKRTRQAAVRPTGTASQAPAAGWRRTASAAAAPARRRARRRCPVARRSAAHRGRAQQRGEAALVNWRLRLALRAAREQMSGQHIGRKSTAAEHLRHSPAAPARIHNTEHDCKDNSQCCRRLASQLRTMHS